METFDGHVQVNRYDAEGLRHELEEDGKLVQFIFRGDEIVAEKTDGKIIRLIRGCSHYSCGDSKTGTGCAGKINRHGIHHVTDFAEDHNKTIGRGYVPNLWILE